MAIIQAVTKMHSEAMDRGEYIDRHAWQFTPDSFRTILRLLNELGLVALRPVRVYNSLFPTNEFWAVLQNP